MYCSRCKATDADRLVKYAKVKTTSGRIIQYYLCSKCNAQKMSNYYKSDKGKESIYKYQERYNKDNPQRRKAWTKASSLPKRPCEVCQSNLNIHKHHPDPNKPYDVVYLCAYHHKLEHKYIIKKISEKSANGKSPKP